MADPKPYRIVSETHEAKWDNQLQQTVEGWTVKALWISTQTIIPVFVPDTHDLVKGVEQLVLAKGAELDALRAPAA